MSLLGDIGSAIVSPVLNALGVVGSASYQNSQAQKQMDFQSKENERARQWQQEEWQRQFDLTNAYNTPAEQVKRLEEAGLNPASVYGASMSASTGQASSGSTPGTVANASPIPDYSGVIAGGVHSIDSLFGQLSTLQDVKKKGVENSRLAEMLDSQIGEVLSRISVNKANEDATRFNTQLEHAFGSARRSAEINELVKRVELASADIALKASQGENVDMDTYKKYSEALLNSAKKTLTDAQFAQLQIDLKYREAVLRSEIRKNEGAAAAGYGIGANASAQAATENEIRQYKVAISKSQSIISEIDANMAVDTKRQRLESVIQEYERSGYLTSEAAARARQEIFKADQQQLDKIVERNKAFLDAVKQVDDMQLARFKALLPFF